MRESPAWTLLSEAGGGPDGLTGFSEPRTFPASPPGRQGHAADSGPWGGGRRALSLDASDRGGASLPTPPLAEWGGLQGRKGGNTEGPSATTEKVTYPPDVF